MVKYTFIQSIEPYLLTDTDSRSDIWLVKNKELDYDCIMKVSFRYVTMNTRSGKKFKYEPSIGKLLSHEISIYQYILKNLIEKENIRNILRVVDSLLLSGEDEFKFLQTIGLDTNQLKQNMVDNFNFMLGFTSERTQIDKKGKITGNVELMSPLTRRVGNVDSRANYTEDMLLQTLVTPKIQTSFDQFVFSNKLFYWEFMRYMFILLTTLGKLSAQGINHNDMHFGNILIDDTFTGGSKFDKNYLLIFREYCILVDLPYTLFIYDFNLSTCNLEMGKNIQPILDRSEYKQKGICPKFHPKRDFVRLLCSMYHFIQTMKKQKAYDPEDEKVFTQIQSDIINKLFTSTKLKNKILQEDSNCWFVNVDGISLLCDDSELDTGIVDIMDILNWCFDYTCWKQNSIRVLDIEDEVLEDSDQILLRDHISVNQLENNIQFVTEYTNPKQFLKNIRSFF
jgi:hypothetical protein